jgi:ABC-2 type transport system permease protein
LIDDWLNGVVLYDLKLESVTSHRLADGRYEVRMHVSAAKESHDKPVPMRENIDVGVFTADDKTLHLAKHALHDGVQDITVIVNGEPAFVAVDPYLTRIDRNRFDNGKRVP